MRTIGVFAKWPEPGKVKTRLAPLLGDQNSAEVALAFLQDTLHKVTGLDLKRLLVYSPSEAEESFRTLLPDGFDLVPQSTGDLGQRLLTFFESQWNQGVHQVVVVGTDSPTLPTSILEQAFERLETSDVVLGPATDGGYYLLGCSKSVPDLFTGIEWSSSQVLQQTIDRIQSANVTLALLPPWYDVDEPEEWQMLVGHLRAMRLAGQSALVPNLEKLLDGSSQTGERGA